MHAILGSIYHPSLYSVSMVKEELLYQIRSLTKQTQASPVVMAAARWFIIEGRMETCAVCEKLTLPQVSSLLWILQLLQERKRRLKICVIGFQGKVNHLYQGPSDGYYTRKHFRVSGLT